MFLPDYYNTILAMYLLLLMVLVQIIVASVAHRMQQTYVPGIVDEDLGPESFVFRSHRTFLNSIENVPVMVALVLVAMLTGLDSEWLGILCWVYLLGRLAHMITYYLIGTRKNPSLRSYFYIIALLAQIILFVMLGLSLI